MFKVIRKQTALLVLTLLATTMATAQTVNMNKYITLTVTQGEQIELGFVAAATGTKVKVVSGSTEQTITVGTGWTSNQNYTAGAGTMTVYGDITKFDCSENGAKLTAIDVSQNTALEYLDCSYNQLDSLNVSHNTALTYLDCSYNRLQLTSLNVTQNRALEYLGCAYNQLTSLNVTQNRALEYLRCYNNLLIALNVSQNRALEDLSCENNLLTALDVSQNRALKYLGCGNNQLTALDISQNMALKYLNCAGNRFTYHDFNNIMCSLPASTAADNAKFCPLWNASDAKYAAFMAANSQIAKDKNWQVHYGEFGGAEIPATNGGMTCPNMNRYITLTVVEGQQVSFGLKADAATPVKIKSGSTDTLFTVSTSWSVPAPYTAGSGTMTIYGDITGLNCYHNAGKLTGIDVSNNSGLKTLFCYRNNFTTQAFNDLMCSLPARTTADGAELLPLSDSSNPDAAAFMAANSQIAKNKNWKVRYYNEVEIPPTTGTYVCPTANMNKYITLTVRQGEQIRLDLQAAIAGTGVKIVSGSTEQTITVGRSWTGFQNYTAGAGTMTIYGDITGFDCSGNGAKLTALDASQNTALTGLGCYGNNFTTQMFDDLMCSLPARTTADNARFCPLKNASDAAVATFMAANAQIAKGKNWKVRYDEIGAGEIPATTGTYTCPTANMSKYITLTVRQGEQISLDLMAVAYGTLVKIVSGSTEQTITVGRSWTGFRNYTAGAGTMTIYGDITGFDCRGNGAYLTALDASKNTALKYLYCYGNNFTTQSFNDIMCSLPARVAGDNAMFYPLRNASDANASAFMAANSQIAKGKNWKVRYHEGNGDIPDTDGTYTCPVIGIAEVASVPIAVYPNPATDILTVETEATGAAITITDLTGRTVLTATATAGETTLNVSELSAGTYIVRVGDRVGKVVKR